MFGILTCFFILSSESVTVAELPSASITIASTFPSFIFVIKSEYFNFVFVFVIIDDNNTINITPIISHIANVLIPFFKIIPPLRLFDIKFYTIEIFVFQ